MSSPFPVLAQKTANSYISGYELDGNPVAMDVLNAIPVFKNAVELIRGDFGRASVGVYMHPGSNSPSSNGNFRRVVNHNGTQHVIGAVLAI